MAAVGACGKTRDAGLSSRGSKSPIRTGRIGIRDVRFAPKADICGRTLGCHSHHFQKILDISDAWNTQGHFFRRLRGWPSAYGARQEGLLGDSARPSLAFPAEQ